MRASWQFTHNTLITSSARLQDSNGRAVRNQRKLEKQKKLRLSMRPICKSALLPIMIIRHCLQEVFFCWVYAEGLPCALLCLHFWVRTIHAVSMMKSKLANEEVHK